MTRYISFLAALCLIVAFWVTLGVSTSARAQDQNIINALKLAKKDQWAAAQNAMSANANPLGQKALSWLAFTDGAPNINFNQMTAFLRQNPDWPYQITMRGRAEDLMPDSYRAAQVIGWFNAFEPVTAGGMARYMEALTQSGQSAKARKLFNEWWAEARLSREEQQDFYAQYGHFVSRETHIKRLNDLLHRSQYSNAQGIGNVLGGDYKKLTAARIALGRQSNNASALVAAVPAHLQNDEGLLFDRLQWRRKNKQNAGAIEILNKSPSAANMHAPKDWWRERHIIARRYMEAGDYETAYRIASSHKQVEGFPHSQAQWLSGFLSVEFLNDPYRSVKHFHALYKKVDSPISLARGAYWMGVASEKLGQPAVAQKWYQDASRYNARFYGQMAQAKLYGSDAQRQFNKGRIGDGLSGAIANQDFARVAQWLTVSGYRKDGAAFLSKLHEVNGGKNASAAQLEQLAAFSARLGQDQFSIKMADLAMRRHGVFLSRYAFPQKLQDMAQVNDIEWALAHSIMRQESRFDQYAISHAGARGLMQLMPATAKQTARKMGLSHQRAWLTSRPDHNIQLGSRYLRQMLDRYDGYYPMAIAAYNAGPGRVDRWIREIGDPRNGSIDFVLWAELIPIYETRNYVQRVMEGVYTYRALMGAQNQGGAQGMLHTAYVQPMRAGAANSVNQVSKSNVTSTNFNN